MLKIVMTSFFSADGGPIWIKFRRLGGPKWKPDVEFQYVGRLGKFKGMSSQSHLPYCRVLPLGDINVIIPEPHATLQGAVSWRNQCHDRATLQGVRIPSAIENRYSPYFIFWFFKCSLSFHEWRLSNHLRYTCLYSITTYCSKHKFSKKTLDKNFVLIATENYVASVTSILK